MGVRSGGMERFGGWADGWVASEGREMEGEQFLEV